MTLDLEVVAVDAVLWAVRSGFLYVDVGGGDYRAGPQRWDAVARVVSSAVRRYRRFRWTAQRRELLLDLWAEHNASEIGAIFGLPAVTVRAELSELRKRLGEDRVPYGQTGRPRREETK